MSGKWILNAIGDCMKAVLVMGWERVFWFKSKRKNGGKKLKN